MNSFQDFDGDEILKCLKYGRQQSSYSPFIRAFAITLHFYSPRAYSYVRSVFNRNLPSVSTIRNWFSSINGAPGFSQEALEILKQKASEFTKRGEELLTCLIFDEINIHKKVEWNHNENKSEGYITYGTGVDEVDENKRPIAKEALVFLVSGVNDNFKLPFGFAFTNSLSASEKAGLVQEALLLLNKTGSKTIGMTFDGLRSNLTMCKELDAGFSSDNPFIINPHSCDEIYAILDACHMMKLARNTLATKKILYDGQNRVIKWEYIEKLYEYQKDNEINIGNKLAKKHIQWDRHKMSVIIAAQTLSDSVATSLQVLLDKGVPQFKDCQATIEYIQTFNNIFDAMNSKHGDNKCFKCPISTDSFDMLFRLFDKTKVYIEGLKLKRNGKCILGTNVQTAFIGFTQNMVNFKLIYSKYVQNGILNEICTFRFSQDLLETLFACIRSMFGCNNNPTTRQFQAAFRKLIGINQIQASKHANCENSDVPILTVSSRKKRNNEHKENSSSDLDSRTDVDVSSTTDTSQISGYVLVREASEIEQQIITAKGESPILCDECVETFSQNTLVDDSYIDSIAAKKFLLIPCVSTVEICQAALSAMKIFNNSVSKYSEIFATALKALDMDSLYSTSTLIQTNAHSNDHKIVLVKKIIELFLRRKFENIHHSKSQDIHDKLLRKKLTKLITFVGE